MKLLMKNTFITYPNLVWNLANTEITGIEMELLCRFSTMIAINSNLPKTGLRLLAAIGTQYYS